MYVLSGAQLEGWSTVVNGGGEGRTLKQLRRRDQVKLDEREDGEITTHASSEKPMHYSKRGRSPKLAPSRQREYPRT